jgi:hypothetical protein
MAESNLSADSVNRGAGTPEEYEDDEFHERSGLLSLAVGLLGLLFLTMVIAVGAVLTFLSSVSF